MSGNILSVGAAVILGGCDAVSDALPNILCIMYEFECMCW